MKPLDCCGGGSQNPAVQQAKEKPESIPVKSDFLTSLTDSFDYRSKSPVTTKGVREVGIAAPLGEFVPAVNFYLLPTDTFIKYA